VGCPARWEVVFVNGSAELLSVRLSGALDGKERAFKLPADGSRSELIENVQRLAVFGPSGALLFERGDFGSKNLPALPGKYPHIYILLTTTNVYSIPPEHRKTWREHFDEITSPNPREGVTCR
jgi:hypothetical protein